MKHYILVLSFNQLGEFLAGEPMGGLVLILKNRSVVHLRRRKAFAANGKHVGGLYGKNATRE
jgi:hypothetical protein